MKSENKLALARLANKTKSRTYLILLIFAALMAVGSIGVIFTPDAKTNPAVGIIAAAVFVFLAFLCYRKTAALKKEMAAMENYREYILRLSSDDSKSLEKLASSMGFQYEKVESEMDMLIKAGLVKNAYIDKQKRVLVLPDRGLYDKTPATVLVAAKCECCSGTTEIPEGTVGTCQFCGSPVSSK